MAEERIAKKEEQVIWASHLPFLYPGHQKKLLIYFLLTGGGSKLSLCEVDGGFHMAQVATLFERKARAATEYLRFVRSLHKLKPFISL